MMTIDPRRFQALTDAAQTPDQILGQADPGVLSGVASAAPAGVARGLAKVQGLATDVAAGAYQPALDAIEAGTGIRATNPFTLLSEASDQAVKYYTPDPITTGAAGQVMRGVADVLTQVGAGAYLAYLTGGGAAGAMWGGAGIAGASTGRATYNEMRDKGVDPSTAANAAFVDGVTVGAGVMLPASMGFAGMAGAVSGAGATLGRGSFLAANAAYGAGANMAMGITQRASISEILEQGGYSAMAEQYRALDGASLAAEGVLGGLFGAVGARAGLPSKAIDVADAAMVARDAAHAAVVTGPGIPADPASAVAHARALDKAINDLSEGRPVDVSQTGVIDGQFVARPRDQSMADEARREYGPALPPAARFGPSERLAMVEPARRMGLRYDAPELNEYAAFVEDRYGLPGGLINALKNAGERSNSNQTSPAGARGVMQFMPENLRKYGVTDPTDPVQMIDAAGRYLRDTSRQYGGNVDAMIADYNGGPRQAREVLAGRQPKAEETRKYLARVREWLGRDTYAQRTDTAGDTLPAFPREQAAAASRIESSIVEAEAVRADLVARLGGEAEAGRVTTMRAEVDDLVVRRQALDEDGAVRQLAKEIQSSETQVSYKQALARAKRETETTAQDLDGQIERLQTQISRNADAARAAQDLVDVDQRLLDLRENRAAIPAPAAQMDPIAAAVRQMIEERPAGQPAGQPGAAPAGLAPSAEAGRSEVASRATPVATNKGGNVAAPRAQRAADGDRPATAEPPPPESSAGGRLAAAATADDIETRAGLAVLESRGDITVPSVDAEGNQTNVSLRQALADADAELQYGRPEAFNAAVLCAMTRGT